MSELINVIKCLHQQIDYDAYLSCNNIHHTAKNCIECCSKPYFKEITINYSCPQKRKLYAVRYLPAYISEIYSALSRADVNARNNLLQTEELSVVSIGGGPGTDIAAFNKWISGKDISCEDNLLKKINYLQVDVCGEWSDISNCFIKLYKLENIEYLFTWIKHDITSSPIPSIQFKKYDVAIISYIISEIDFDKIDSFSMNIKQIVSEGSLLVINDRPETDVIKKIDQFLKIIGSNNVKQIPLKQQEHCELTYPNDIYKAAKPTIFKKSIGYIVVI